MDLLSLSNWLNSTYPGRDWNQQCQRLVWNVVWRESGIPEGQMATYPTATAARLASDIVSHDVNSAPLGAIHYWRNPAEGHVGVSLGNGAVLMTGTPYALGAGGYQLGNNYGVTTVHAYTSRMGNPYLGWSFQNGSNPSIVKNSSAAPSNGKKEEDMAKNSALAYTRSADGKQVVVVGNAGSGFEFEYVDTSGKFNSELNNGISRAFDTGPFVSVQEYVAEAFKKSLAQVRQALAGGK